MATIKSFSDLQQSKKLAEILPIESADMCYYEYTSYIDGTPKVGYKEGITEGIPCWSLASLLEQLHYEVCDDDGNSFYLQIDKEYDCYQLAYTDPYEDFESIETSRYDNFVDACYELILKLNELNLL